MLSTFFENAWRWKCGMPEKEPPKKFPSLEELRKTQWSEEFEKHMRIRLIMGGMRYGFLNAKNKPQYNRIEAARNRLRLYQLSGNTEYLVDIANICLLEFEEGIHPNKHFKSISNRKDHVKQL